MSVNNLMNVCLYKLYVVVSNLHIRFNNLTNVCKQF